MNILIAGGTGLIGSALSRNLISNGHQVTILTRGAGSLHQGADAIHWDGRTRAGWAERVGQVDAIVNLAGENIGSGRWTPAKKDSILRSRLEAGKVLAEVAGDILNREGIFLQASAVGYYGVSEQATMTENSPAGRDYLAGVAVQWEDASATVEALGIKRAVIRTGIVLDPGEGALARMLLPFRLFAGGPLGSGRQWMSWIHLVDEVNAIRFILENKLVGNINLTAPNPVSNADFGKAIARALHRPYWMPVPGFALKLLLGEMSTLVLDGQKVLPDRLIEAGYTFKFPKLDGALSDLLG